MAVGGFIGLVPVWYLVLDEGQERGDDKCTTGFQHGRQLVAEALASSRGHEAEHVSTLHGGIYHLLLLLPAHLSAHMLTFVVRVTDEEMVGLDINPWFGHLGTWKLSWGRTQRNCTLAEPREIPGTPLTISLRWLECVDDELSLAVKTISFSQVLILPKCLRSDVWTHLQSY